MRAIRWDDSKQIVVRRKGSERSVLETTDWVVKEIERLVKAKVAEVGA